MASSRRRVRSIVGRVLRPLAACLLVLAMSDVVAAVHRCVEGPHGCGDACAMCFCRRDAAKTRLRLPCPCCQSQPSSATSSSSLDPLVVPHHEAPRPPTVQRDVAPDVGECAPSCTPDIPHPPPRRGSFA